MSALYLCKELLIFLSLKMDAECWFEDRLVCFVLGLRLSVYFFLGLGVGENGISS